MSGIPIFFTMIVIVSAMMLEVIVQSIRHGDIGIGILAFEMILFQIVALFIMVEAESIDEERDRKYHTQGI